MKLLLVNQYYPPDTAPTGQYLHQLARVLVERGHEVTVICSRRAYNGNSVYAAEETVDGVRVRRIFASGFGRKSGFGKILDYATFYLSLLSALFSPRSRADAILALTTPPHLGLLVKIAAGLKRAVRAHWVMDIYPDVLAAHGNLAASSLPYRLLAALTRFELRGSPLVFCLGDDMAARLNHHLRLPPDDRTVVESLPLWSDASLAPWDQAEPPSFRKENGWTERDLVLMYSGNMGRGHRFGEFIEAARATKNDRSTHWIFAGGGARKAEVEAAAKQEPDLNLRVLPYAPMEKLREHLCSADAHLVSLDSAWQGCMVPSKFQGIFAIGKPVIFVGGRENSLAQWIEESGGGWVAPENDVPALLAAVQEARQPGECRRRGELARAYAAKRFDFHRNVQRMAGLLETRCRRPAP